MVSEKALSFIGIAMKAGKVVTGEFSVEKAVKSGRARVVVVAGDASANTKKLFTDKCSFYEVPCVVAGTKELLGKVTGKEFRASLAITDAGFAKGFLEKLESQK